MPVGCHDDEMPWGRDSDNILETKQLYGQYSLLCGLLLKTMFLLWCLFCMYFWLEIVFKKFLKAAKFDLIGCEFNRRIYQNKQILCTIGQVQKFRKKWNCFTVFWIFLQMPLVQLLWIFKSNQLQADFIQF